MMLSVYSLDDAFQSRSGYDRLLAPLLDLTADGCCKLPWAECMRSD